MSKSKTFLMIALMAAILPAKTYAQGGAMEASTPMVFVIGLSGVKANVPLSDIVFNATLAGGGSTFSNSVSVGPLAAGEIIGAALEVDVTGIDARESLNFTLNLSGNDAILLNASGIIQLPGMDSTYTSLYVNPVAIKSDNGGLTFSSIGIIGSITAKIALCANVTSPLTATLTWRKQTMTATASSLRSEFAYPSLTSPLPTIPFELNVSNDEVNNLVFAVGELRIEPGKISIPMSINHWNPYYVSGWNITFTCARYAIESRLPLTFSSRGTEVVSTPKIYIADFRENGTRHPGENDTQRSIEEPRGSRGSQAGLLDTISRILLTPIGMILTLALAGIIAMIVVIKLRKAR